ncbi:MAG: hypothetical protein ACOY3P_24930 [Planctomycetota bacterium]
MSLVDLISFTRRRKASLVAELADQVARHCSVAVRCTVPTGDPSFSPAMLRGYWRAHARAIVADYLTALEADGFGNVCLHDHVAEAALTRVVDAAAALPSPDEIVAPRRVAA